MSKIIGIDLGTTNSVVCALEGGEPKVISNEEGGRTTPSVVAFEEGGNVLVGQQARRQSITNPENTIYSAKRFIGRRYDEVKEDAARVPYGVTSGPGGDARFSVRGKQYSPAEISAHVLRKLKKAAEDFLGEPVTEAVITVPAYFNDAQRQATKDAGKIAGLEVRRIINEPTAAALAFARGKADSRERLVGVYDLGGGTFDISLLEVTGDVVEVVATSGDTHLGGDDFDDRIIDWLLESFEKDTGIDVGKDKLVMQRLKDAAEKAKIELSASQETEINLPFLTADATGPKHLQIRLSRAKFESLIADLVERTLGPVRQVLKDAGKSATAVDEVLLVGGSTRVPLVQQKVQELFGKAPNKSVNPDEVVAMGAALQGGIIGGDVKDILLVDVTPLSLGIETLGGVMTVLIPRNTTIPTKKSEVFSTAVDNQPSVEVHVLQGERKMAADNRTLAKFGLEGIPPAPRGMPQIEVTFDIDANGIVDVSATDKATGKAQRVTIKDSSGLSEAEVEAMVRDAEKNAAEDERRRKEAEDRNALEALVFQTQRTMAEHGERLPPQKRHEFEGVIADAENALKSGDARAVSTVRERLTAAAHDLARAAYGAAAPGGAPSEPTEAAPSEGEVIDAEFEEKAS